MRIPCGALAEPGSVLRPGGSAVPDLARPIYSVGIGPT
jgi:hypothetical protein